MTRLAVILGALALVATASSVRAGLPEAPPDVHTDGDSRCNVSDDGNSASGSCCVGNSDGSISCVIETVTSVPSADSLIVPRNKFKLPTAALGKNAAPPPWPSYVNPHAYPSRWPLVPLPHAQRHYSFGSSVIAHPPVPVHRLSSNIISRAAVISRPTFARRAAFAKSFGRVR